MRAWNIARFASTPFGSFKTCLARSRAAARMRVRAFSSKARKRSINSATASGLAGSHIQPAPAVSI